MDKYLNISEKVLGHCWWRPQAVLKVTGEDALTFLQGQVTQDLKNASSGAVQYGLWLTPKGRVFADSVFFIVSPQEIFLMSERTSASLLCARMEQYIIADDVYFEDITDCYCAVDIYSDEQSGALKLFITDCYCAVDIYSDEQSGALKLCGKPVPVLGKWEVFEGGFLFHRWPDVSEIFRVILPREKERKLADLPGAELSREEVEWDRIARGRAVVPDDVGPGELPNEAGLETIAISYTKGCYLGQETMARLKSMGQIRRQLFRIQGIGSVPLARPLSVFQEGKRVGELKTTAVGPDGRFLGFALITLLAFDRQRPLQIEGLPGDVALVN